MSEHNMYDKLETAFQHMKSHDSNIRIRGIHLFTEFIKFNYVLLSTNIIQRLRLVFECEHDTEVLLKLSKLCTKLGLVSLLEGKICNLNADELDYFRNGRITNTTNQVVYNSYDDSLEYDSCSKDDKRLLIMEKISSIVPILQDIAELDDVYVRIETLKSLKSLINIITFIIEEYIHNINSSIKSHNELALMFNNSLEIFEKLANSDIISHKILSCHIIPLILEQKRLSEIFVDEKNILLSKYSDFCVHPAPILRKHASKVFNSILEHIEYEENMIEVLVLPMIQNFCCDEQEGVRLMAIENIEAFFLQATEFARLNYEYIRNVFLFFERLQPYIFILYNDANWRIRSNVSKHIINIYTMLFYLEELSEIKNIEIYNDMKHSGNVLNRDTKNHITDNENESQNSRSQINENNLCENSYSKNSPEKLSECIENNLNENNLDHLNRLVFILTHLLMDPEPETRINTLSNILRTVEEQVSKYKPNIENGNIRIFHVTNTLFCDVVIKQINSNLHSDTNATVRVNLTRILKIIIIMKTKFEIDERTKSELETTFDNLIVHLINDDNNQVRQSAVLALSTGISESDDINFLISNILPHLNSIVKDKFWRVRYCSVILLIMSLYKILLSRFESDEIWGGNISNYPEEVIKDFFNSHMGTVDWLVELITINASDKASIIRQITSIFAFPLLSRWLGHEWTKNRLWSKIILPMLVNEKSYIMRITGLLSANSIITGINVHSFKELLDVSLLITQLTFTVTPTINSTNIDEYKSCQDHIVNNRNTILTPNESVDQDNSFMGDNIHGNNRVDLSSYYRLAEYIPSINASSLILSFKPSCIKTQITKEINRSIDYNELQLEIVSVILRSSVNDIVPNVRVKAYQTINSFVNINGIGTCQKSIIDQVKYSLENDPDSDVKAYCSEILKINESRV
ncbi:protein phosphatase regulator-like heat repeat-containing protein [Cryptosporidium canis]|uniref:Protein phosphatase regulator-like heat repeat-containing protein n=1 Tax=Cryptosporidium canis TaxID=195482 RepID=A0A9D5DHY5_9CRYT|nr:protein phosphatase regulator-like heat repeat-containing protein [Cryptosporidium canis]